MCVSFQCPTFVGFYSLFWQLCHDSWGCLAHSQCAPSICPPWWPQHAFTTAIFFPVVWRPTSQTWWTYSESLALWQGTISAPSPPCSPYPACEALPPVGVHLTAITLTLPLNQLSIRNLQGPQLLTEVPLMKSVNLFLIQWKVRLCFGPPIVRLVKVYHLGPFFIEGLPSKLCKTF